MLPADQIRHHRLLFFQLGDRRIELGPAEFVQRNVLHDLPFPAASRTGKEQINPSSMP